MPVMTMKPELRTAPHPPVIGHARRLRAALGIASNDLPVSDMRSAQALWADSGAMALTGTGGGLPLHSPAPLAACMLGVWQVLAGVSNGVLDPGFAAHRLLGERAAIAGLRRNGMVSAGGGCRLLAARDAMLALNMAREDDWRLLPAWLETPVDDWDSVAECVAGRESSVLLERARLLGLAAAVMAPAPERVGPWFHLEARSERRTAVPGGAPLVLDLGSLWAAPLCTSVLGMMGARVIRVESEQRLDGARYGPAAFFDLLNAGKESVVLDLRLESGRRSLRRLLECADIVVESARPRALEQMGIRAAELVRRTPGRTWIAITGYGRRAPMRDWIAYGDDAGVAAGLSDLLRRASGQTVFCGDAIADPLTGLHAALLAWLAWRNGSGGLFDVSLHAVAAHAAALHATVDWHADEGHAAVSPVARAVRARAVPAGVDTARVLRELLR